MLYVFGFERIGVAVSDLYFVDPQPNKGQEGPEHGVRLELRMLDQGEPQGTVYAARPISLGRPIWRVDLLESVDGRPGSFDRTHHHPVFTDWNPGPRVFARDLSADPLGWLAERLSDLDGVLKQANVDETYPQDAVALRERAHEIISCVEGALADVRAGRLGTAPPEGGDSIRASWL
ncbi:hypothetical protein ACQEUU_29150 [Nonomuraea sp. CA-218870]|uniref:hypothetical protein n=1 Tax=Nonomuraea sp. CA-218870 TaxID=3239998 RepID=UPI003D8D6239